jgi:thiol-disulfide isomerase/thioredoxin
MGNRLLFFTGRECGHCHKLEPVADKVAEGLKVKITKLEVWHNSANKKLLLKYDKINCKGVPFLYNEKTGKGLCGTQSEEKIKKWMQGG